MDFRHEWKHEIGQGDLLALRARLRAVMAWDEHSVNGKYEIRSLYFDNLADRALREKIDGVNSREKFRVRYYNGDTSFILLEKKEQMQRSLQQGSSYADPAGGSGHCCRGTGSFGGEHRTSGLGAVSEDADPRLGTENHCGLYPGALCLCSWERTGDTGLPHPYRTGLY